MFYSTIRRKHLGLCLCTFASLVLSGCGGSGDSSSSRSSPDSTISSSMASSSSSHVAMMHPTCGSEIENAYQSKVIAVPGYIQAEDFDPEGYSDSSTENEGGQYRTDTEVDIKQISGGYAVGWMTAGEWLEYTIYVPSEKDYSVTIRSGSADTAVKTLSITQCDNTLLNTFNVPAVSSWGDLKTRPAGTIHLQPGYQKIRVNVGDTSYVDFDWLYIGPYEGSLDPLTNPADTLLVQLDQVIRPVSHVASGALYGVVEQIPASISDLVAPLKPKSYTQPAVSGAGRQQPYGSAIAVSERLAGVTDAAVTIRLADILPGWPYKWAGWSSWESNVRAVVDARRNSGRTNYYGYEIWNEPYGTWNSANGDFKSALWKPTFDLLRTIDPQVKIIGPSLSFFSQSRISEFLSFCKTNNCLPDIICWHQWGSETLSANIDSYRALEVSLGISPRLISINEYSHDTHEYEGAPGPSAPFIAKFERKGVDTANISWWFPALPGRLGSLITAQNQRNGGWWFYKWYGDMSGDMVNTIPPNDKSDGLDGFANIDLVKQFASVALGGNHTGTVSVEISGIPSVFGNTVNVKVEHVTWASKETAVSGPITDAQSIYIVVSGSITVPVNMTNALWGYRVYLTP